MKLDPATQSDLLQPELESLLVRLGRRVAGPVHAADVLCEEIFTVELVVAMRRSLTGEGRYRGRLPALCPWLRDATANVASVDARPEMLRGDVPFVLVLGAESGRTAIASESAGERAGVGGKNMFVEAGGRGAGMRAEGAGLLVG